MRKGSKHTEEAKAKIGKAKLGKKFTEEHKANISKGLTGYKQTAEHKANMSGSNHPNYGKKWSAERRAKKSLATSGKNNPQYGKKGGDHPSYGRKNTAEQTAKKSGKNNHMYGRKGKDAPRYGRKASAETLDRTTGINHYNWQGGISCEPYCDVWLDKEFKESIKQRDGYKCQNPDCWDNCNHLTLGVHHINYIKKDCHPNNLLTLCVSCNARANVNREYWQEKFKQRGG